MITITLDLTDEEEAALSQLLLRSAASDLSERNRLAGHAVGYAQRLHEQGKYDVSSSLVQQASLRRDVALKVREAVKVAIQSKGLTSN